MSEAQILVPEVFSNFFQQTQDINHFKKFYIDQFKLFLDCFEFIDLAPLEKKIIELHQNGKKIITLGNGGSAANAAHFCTGISYVSRMWGRPLKSINLTQDALLISSVANDHGFDDIFYRQLQVLLDPGDILFAFSVSGKSKNVLKAVEFARSKNSFCVGFTGFDGGDLIKKVDLAIHLPQVEKIQGFAEDGHMVLGHLLSCFLELRLKSLLQNSPKII